MPRVPWMEIGSHKMLFYLGYHILLELLAMQA